MPEPEHTCRTHDWIICERHIPRRTAPPRIFLRHIPHRTAPPRIFPRHIPHRTAQPRILPRLMPCIHDAPRSSLPRWFGEDHLLSAASAEATVTAVTDVSCLALRRSSLERVLGPLEAVVEEARQREAERASRRQRQQEEEGLQNCSLDDFVTEGLVWHTQE